MSKDYLGHGMAPLVTDTIDEDRLDRERRACECIYPGDCTPPCPHDAPRVATENEAFINPEADRSMGLPTDAKARKEIPVATGCIDYFPDALAAVAELSWHGNNKHNPGQPLHWSRGKSSDHPDCLMRHFIDRGKKDEIAPGVVVRHSTQMAWRALAILQLEIEADRKR